MVVKLYWGRLSKLLLLVLLLFLYNEYLVYYVTLLQCAWPEMTTDHLDVMIDPGQSKPLKVMVIADTHLLGSFNGHWFDKLRREWQMQRSFQTTFSIHSPEVVFVLGDLFDEGKICNDQEFQETVARFHHMFSVDASSQIQVVVGNHDVGFHYMMTGHKINRFKKAFKTPSVRMMDIQGNLFVLANSMAFEGDGCDICQRAERQLQEISVRLKCAQGRYTAGHCEVEDPKYYTRPILLQHFPMYRTSDANCSGPDSAPVEEKYVKFRPKVDCLSEKASNRLLESVQPRLVLSAHTHHFCYRELPPHNTPEWTLPSFSWRNIKNPSFLLIKVSNNNYAISKCYLPDERTVIWTYIIGGVAIACWLIISYGRGMRFYFSKRDLIGRGRKDSEISYSD